MNLRSGPKNKRPLESFNSVDIPSKRPRWHHSLSVPKEESTSSALPPSPQKAKKLKLQSSYATQSPFADYPYPTPQEALDVYNLLKVTHRPNIPIIRLKPQPTTNSAQTCGNVPNVIEALIGTILSQNTSGSNSSRAKQALDDSFGRNNFSAIVNAPKQKVVDAIKSGGLANKKAEMIQGLLKAIKEKHGDYSLQHLAGEPNSPGAEPTVMSDEEIMQELLSYTGVGPKTASCVLLFCLGKDSFAVDTHVYRLSRLLGWVPGKADRILTQAHLDLRIPADLKYGLHVLMIDHGRACKGCKKSGSGEACVLKDYLKQKKIKTEEEFDHRLQEVNKQIEVKMGDEV